MPLLNTNKFVKLNSVLIFYTTRFCFDEEASVIIVALGKIVDQSNERLEIIYWSLHNFAYNS